MASVRSLAILGLAFSFLLVFVLSDRPSARQDLVRLASGSVVSLRTPEFVQVGRRYAFTWAGGGPAQTYTVKQKREDGWVLVEVAEENINPAFLIAGEVPTRWLNIATATSIQEMRPYQ